HAIDELVTEIRRMGGKMSLASMRADSISPAILTALIETGARTITFAPEGGSQRMRDVINKNLTEEQILECVDLVGRLGGRALALVEDVNYNQWNRALAATGLTEDFYTRGRPVDELFPWSHIEEGVSNRALEKQWEKANSEQPGYDKAIPRSGVRPMIAVRSE